MKVTKDFVGCARRTDRSGMASWKAQKLSTKNEFFDGCNLLCHAERSEASAFVVLPIFLDHER
jgi:hypothetical protein